MRNVMDLPTEAPPRPRLSRRRSLALAAATGATAALGDALLTYAPWQDYEAQAGACTSKARGLPR